MRSNYVLFAIAPILLISAVFTPSAKAALGDVYCDPPFGGVNTALGCLHSSTATTFVSEILSWSVGIGSVAAFIVLVYAGIMVSTASGDPKRVKAGQELIGSALAGLVLIALAVVLLNFIGVKILNLPSFGFSV